MWVQKILNQQPIISESKKLYAPLFGILGHKDIGTTKIATLYRGEVEQGFAC